MMRITCLGAARCVTGSCYLVDTGQRKVLVDCGLFQGGRQMDALNVRDWGFDPAKIDALFLTHAHVDHCGRIPKLVKDGFKGKIHSTLPTAELCKILLLDSAHIQEMESEWQTKRNRRGGKGDVEPLYTVKDAEACFPLIDPIPRDEVISFGPDLKMRYRTAGHILGASILEVWNGEPGDAHKVVFSGDLGRKGQLIVRDPEILTEADTLFMESTYGDRDHKSFDESREELLDAVRYSYRNGEKVIIPAFAVERTQELLLILGEAFRKGLIPSIPVYLDSPLAIAATQIFRRMGAFYDEKTMALLTEGHAPFDFPQLVLSRSTEESIAINQTTGSAIVIAGNGMCTAGRIKHHLKHNLWRKGASLVIVGFQAIGTLGRNLVDGAKLVRVFGEKVSVRAKVFTIGGFSAHADRSNLIEWLGHFKTPHMRVFVIHGEENASEAFARLIRERLGLEVFVPALGETISTVAWEPSLVIRGVPPSGWREKLHELVRRTERIERIFGELGPDATRSAEREIEKELSRAAYRLDEILDAAGKKGGPEATREE